MIDPQLHLSIFLIFKSLITLTLNLLCSNLWIQQHQLFFRISDLSKRAETELSKRKSKRQVYTHTQITDSELSREIILAVKQLELTVVLALL